MKDIDKLKLIYDYIYYRCTKCNKALDKDGTYIEVHKQGMTFPFCKDCGEAALNCMKWYGEIVSLQDIKEDKNE